MKHFALTGISIAHSKSPQLFEAAYHGKHTYELMPATSAADALRLFEEKGLSGMNVTTPFKEEIVPLVYSVDEDVKRLGAANIVVREGYALKAYNSDVYGCVGALRTAGVNLLGTECLVLGWGGAARAATLGLMKCGARVTVANRRITKITLMKKKFPVEIKALKKVVSQTEQYPVIINALPVIPGLAESITLFPHQVLLEADYSCGPLREVTQRAGAQYIDGLQWLLHQAIPAFRIFTGEEPDIPAMCSHLRTLN